MSKIQVNLDELQNFAIQLGKAANECDQALGHINVDLYSLLANVPGVANGQINKLEKIFRNNLKKYKNRLDDSQRLIRMTVAKMNETEMLLAREASEVGRDHAGYYANLGMFNGSSGNSSGGKTDRKYLSKDEFSRLNNRLVEVDEVIDEHMEMGGKYHVYDDGLIVRKYLDMTGEKFITRYEIVDKIPNKDRTGGSKDLDSYFEGTPLAAVEYIGKPSTIAEKGVTKLVRKAAKEDYLLKVSKDIQERLAVKLSKQEPALVMNSKANFYMPGDLVKIEKNAVRERKPDLNMENKGFMSIGNLKYKKISETPAESVNKWWKEEMGYSEPPYKPGTIVQEIQLTEKTTFVRVYDGVNSGMYGGWFMRAEDIRGLTPIQIQEKFALPTTPKYVVDVELDAGTRNRTGTANPLFGFEGGGQQYDLMGQRMGNFTNSRPLP